MYSCIFLSLLLSVVVTEALKLVGWLLSDIVGQRGDAFFVLDVFEQEWRC